MKIQEDKPCNFCESTCDTNRNRCEGCHYGDAEEKYKEAHGIIDEKPVNFEHITAGDVVYELVIKSNFTQLITTVVQSKLDHIVDGKRCITLRLKASNTAKEVQPLSRYAEGLYIRKEDAIAAYTTIISSTVMKMTQHLVEFTNKES